MFFSSRQTRDTSRLLSIICVACMQGERDTLTTEHWPEWSMLWVGAALQTASDQGATETGDERSGESCLSQPRVICTWVFHHSAKQWCNNKSWYKNKHALHVGAKNESQYHQHFINYTLQIAQSLINIHQMVVITINNNNCHNMQYTKFLRKPCSCKYTISLQWLQFFASHWMSWHLLSYK